MILRTFASTLVLAAAISACAPSSEKPAAPADTAATTPTPPPPAAPAITPIPASENVHPFTIGAFQAAALRDGGLEPANDGKTFAINKKPKDVADLLKANNLPTDKIPLSVQPLLVKTTDKVLLFDTGAGGMFGPTLGKLPAAWAATGVDAGAVTDIFISHGHGDHVGGLVKADGSLAFPNAAIHMSANEWAAMKADKEKSASALAAAITPKVVTFEPNADLIPGVVKAVDIKGHTPGHSGYLITSGSDSLLYQGDVMHSSIISVQQPDWTIAFDGDAPTAQASRKAMLESWAASGQRIYAVHFPFPGLGKYEKKGDGYVWTPEP